MHFFRAIHLEFALLPLERNTKNVRSYMLFIEISKIAQFF